jgi:TonB family protein
MSTTNSANMSLDTFTMSSKKISNYAISISVAAHLLMLGAVKYGYLFQSAPVAANEESYVDLGYQVLNEVPLPPPVAAKSEEMQDDSSNVQSLQKEKSKPMVASSTATPTYSDVPYYKIKPKYPKDALEAGLEGNVKMTIDILEDGTVENIKVTGGEKLGTFESAAMRSVAKWKYKPFTDAAGNPIKKTNYMVQVDFKIKDEIATQ